MLSHIERTITGGEQYHLHEGPFFARITGPFALLCAVAQLLGACSSPVLVAGSHRASPITATTSTTTPLPVLPPRSVPKTCGTGNVTVDEPTKSHDLVLCLHVGAHLTVNLLGNYNWTGPPWANNSLVLRTTSVEKMKRWHFRSRFSVVRRGSARVTASNDPCATFPKGVTCFLPEEGDTIFVVAI